MIQGYNASAILGSIGEGVAGAVPKSSLIRVDTNSVFIPRSEAIRANNIADIRAVTTTNSFIANFSGAAVSADIGGLGTKVINNGIDYTQRHMNLQSNQRMLELPYQRFNQNDGYKGIFLMPPIMIKATP
ncbi:hypothetical protein F3J02_01235 [Acinetobacter sp. Tr-809]|uniref:hypothetical protein n=1 Tax=Acinetobacter sp. Tr-809 TaxID=2608324 RepID=UPI00141FE91C|nr:hypothetical protein [Acinetobacter sp. Tr-809]NIE95121.1 hypothetical protein [Acinetobacter sp. Tr-809]